MDQIWLKHWNGAKSTSDLLYKAILIKPGIFITWFSGQLISSFHNLQLSTCSTSPLNYYLQRTLNLQFQVGELFEGLNCEMCDYQMLTILALKELTGVVSKSSRLLRSCLHSLSSHPSNGLVNCPSKAATERTTTIYSRVKKKNS